ncbi:MAG TPA: DUF3830 family protein [Candidatus Limnocylindrales bacterium]|nr:DUF3830 family protein [Candidatus Limnocylindrales bacterium]
MPSLELEVDGVTARFALRDDLAPQTVRALVASLPVETTLRHCRWSGDACFAEIARGPILEISALESGVTSIYPGTLVLRPANAIAPTAEILIAYGDAEYRWPTSRMYVTPVGEVQGDPSALFKVLAKTSSAGQTTVRLAALKEAVA